MPDYRVYFIGWDGHFLGAIDFQAASDQHAIAKAPELRKGHEVEVWESARFVRRLSDRLLICRRWPRQASFSKPSTPLAAPGPDEVKDICASQPQRHRRSAAC
jgi:hypothetical protein